MPRYPVTDPAPEFETIVTSMNSTDVLGFAAISTLSIPYGYMIGRPRTVLAPTMAASFAIGTLGGFIWAYTRSAFRLRGLNPPN